MPGYKEIVPDMLSAIRSKSFGVFRVSQKLLQVVIRSIQGIGENSGVLVINLQGNATDRRCNNGLGLPKRFSNCQAKSFPQRFLKHDCGGPLKGINLYIAGRRKEDHVYIRVAFRCRFYRL
ncbi:Uncharacterised protein [uncultured archaeon]|nr:Uncharacterised protein [uncultured archaeon]